MLFSAFIANPGEAAAAADLFGGPNGIGPGETAASFPVPTVFPMLPRAW